MSNVLGESYYSLPETLHIHPLLLRSGPLLQKAESLCKNTGAIRNLEGVRCMADLRDDANTRTISTLYLGELAGSELIGRYHRLIFGIGIMNAALQASKLLAATNEPRIGDTDTDGRG